MSFIEKQKKSTAELQERLDKAFVQKSQRNRIVGNFVKDHQPPKITETSPRLESVMVPKDIESNDEYGPVTQQSTA